MEKLPLDRTRWPFIALVACAAMMATAYAVEFLLHFAPCQMCHWQRYVYWTAGGVALLGIAVNWRGARPQLMAGLCVLLGLIFAAGAFIAIWHSLVEWKVVPPLDGCVANRGAQISGNLWDQLSRPIAVPSCDKAPFHVLGLSMAGWNAVASIALAAASFFAATRSARTDTANEPLRLEEAA
jgi:disulfide bond formation protein DsbB